MSVVSLLYVHILWHVEICQAFMLRILSVSLGMKVRNVNDVNSTEDPADDDPLRIVLPILIVLVLLAISSAILFAFFRHFKKKDTEEPTKNNQQVVTVCVRTNKLTFSMQCWRRLFHRSYLLFYCMFGPSFSSRLVITYALSYTSLSEHGLLSEIKIGAQHSLLGQYSHCANVRLLVTVFEQCLVKF
jgi:hypothetical protein